MDTFEYLRKNFILYTKEKYNNSYLSPYTKEILCNIGIPEEPIESLKFDVRLNEDIQLFEENIVIGNNEGINICINQKNEIIAIDPQDKLFSRYINKDLKSFLDYIVIFLISKEKALNAKNENEKQKILEEMLKKFDILDKFALSDEENWWSVIVEQIEMGLM